MYDASPFICHIDGIDTIMYHYMFNDDAWLTPTGFKPTEGVISDTTTYDDYQYGYTGKFITPDSNLALSVEYFAPKTVSDSCDFIVMKQRIWNESGSGYSGIFIGDAMDWDIPTDSGSRNQSDYNETLKLMWQMGYEYDPDSIVNDDCVLADHRYGGFSYYGGFRLPAGQASNDSIGDPRAMWTEKNARFVYPEGDFVGGQMYTEMVNKTGYSTWEPNGDFTNPDSVATDLHMISVFGEFDLGVGDTLVFVKILASEYNLGQSGLETTIEKARAWIGDHPEIFTWPEFSESCCDMPGDANDDGAINILDITWLIAFIYPPPGDPPPPCMYEGDANGDCTHNILDITYLIAFIYPPPGDPAPICAPSCPGW
jgi:hypothetical protein